MTALQKYRLSMGIFTVGLVLSGITAFPLLAELRFSSHLAQSGHEPHGLTFWIRTVRDGLSDTYGKYPWVAYGTDWLGFAHIIIALFFVRPLISPVGNIQTIRTGLLACCFLIIPFAFIVGEFRHIPLGWRLIDCSFGVFGAIPLYYCLRITKQIAREQVTHDL